MRSMQAFVLSLVTAAALASGPNDGILPSEELLPPLHNDDPYVEEVLRVINLVSPYEVPALELRRELYIRATCTLEPTPAPES